jgi:hypothetical protein
VHAEPDEPDAAVTQRHQQVGDEVRFVHRRGDAAALRRRDGINCEDRHDRFTRVRRLARVGEPELERRLAGRRLQLVGRALGDHCAAVDHGDAVGELVGLVEVLRRQQHRRPRPGEPSDGLPHPRPGAWVQARGRLVEEDQGRRRDEARGEIETSAHAS